MGQDWQIEYYTNPQGDKPVEEFINKQDEAIQVKIVRLLEHLEEFGVQVGPPHVKRLTGTKLWELRILGANNIRIFYIAEKGQIFLLLHAFKKKKQKTDKRELKTAEERLVQYRLVKGD